MLPLGDTRKPSITPFVTRALIAINVIIFLFMFPMSFPQLEEFIFKYALIPSEIIRGQNLHTLFTSMFMHGGIGHIFSNMLFLHVFGDNLEAKFGHLKYLLFYLVCGIGASALQIFIDPGSMIPNLGASGAIAGLMGGYLVLFPHHQIDVLIPFGWMMSRARVPAYTMLIYWIGFQLLLGFGSLASPITGGIAYFAHIGGFLSGVILTYLSRPFLRNRNYSYI